MARLYKPRLKLCDCGCGAYARGDDFLPGHDNRIYSAIVSHVGGLRNLREVVEQYTGKPIDINARPAFDEKIDRSVKTGLNIPDIYKSDQINSANKTQQQ